MNRLRRRILEKVAQQTTTTNQAPSEQQGAQQPAQQPGNQQASPDVRTFMTSLNVGWGNNISGYIASLIGQLDKAILAGTQNKFSFKSLYDSNFQGIDGTYASPVSDVLKLSKTVFAQLLNNKNAFRQELQNSDKLQRASIVNSDPSIGNLGQINPTSELGKKGVSLASVKDTIQAILNQIPRQ